jgi:hypothetical protein
MSFPVGSVCRHDYIARFGDGSRKKEEVEEDS